MKPGSCMFISGSTRRIFLCALSANLLSIMLWGRLGSWNSAARDTFLIPGAIEVPLTLFTASFVNAGSIRGLTIKFANLPPCACSLWICTYWTVNQVYYLEVLKRLREKVRRKRPELFANNSWILHHDNAPAHMTLPVREFLATKQITVLEHPAYSPDLAPSDFFLFPKIKVILKGRHFDDIDDIRSNTTAALKVIPQNQFQNCFEGWTRRWNWSIASQGEYFEGDRGGIQQWGM